MEWAVCGWGSAGGWVWWCMYWTTCHAAYCSFKCTIQVGGWVGGNTSYNLRKDVWVGVVCSLLPLAPCVNVCLSLSGYVSSFSCQPPVGIDCTWLILLTCAHTRTPPPAHTYTLVHTNVFETHSWHRIAKTRIWLDLVCLDSNICCLRCWNIMARLEFLYQCNGTHHIKSRHAQIGYHLLHDDWLLQFSLSLSMTRTRNHPV